ncbi:hypothetical protein DFQ28_007144 [Apophysomyces sp. BC1034]|nr:hypothetical protein DFQ29_005981 [Apophysomyces sp. BC1021]KAG0186915.1 hypothetical protein DFQ28_007144 [Apophysomyces sp. BC1034]
MCENVKCSYPFDQPTIDPFIEIIPNASRVRRKRRTSSQVPIPASSRKISTAPTVAVDLHLPSATSAQTFSNNNQGNPEEYVWGTILNVLRTVTPTTGYSLADIENLLSKEDDATSYTPTTTSSAVTPPDSNSNMIWFDGLDDMLNMGSVDFKLDPLQSGNGELDSLLGFH